MGEAFFPTPTCRECLELQCVSPGHHHCLLLSRLMGLHNSSSMFNHEGFPNGLLQALNKARERNQDNNNYDKNPKKSFNER